MESQTEPEIRKAVRQITTRKAPGTDNIPPECEWHVVVLDQKKKTKEKGVKPSTDMELTNGSATEQVHLFIYLGGLVA